MMDEQPINIAMIEQIVAGELSDLERKALLSQMVLEDSADSWRALALGLLGKRMLREAFAEPELKTDVKPKSRAWLLVGMSAAMLMIGALLSSMFLQGFVESALVSSDTPAIQTEEDKQSIETETTYLAAQLEDGRQLVIPISHFTVSDSVAN